MLCPTLPDHFTLVGQICFSERKENQTNNLAQNAKPSQLRQQPPHTLPCIPLHNLLRPIIRLENLVIQRIPLMRAIEEILIHPPIISAQSRIE